MPFDLTNISDTSLIFGGLTIAVVCLVWVLYGIFRLYYKTVTNHGHDWQNAINRNSDAFIENAKSNQALVDVILLLKKKKK